MRNLNILLPVVILMLITNLHVSAAGDATAVAAEAHKVLNQFDIIYGDIFFMGSSCCHNITRGDNSDGIEFRKESETCQSKDDNRYLILWVTVYDEPISANYEKNIESIKSSLNNVSSSKDVEILNLIVDGYDVIVGNATNRSNSTDKEILATFWIDESNGYGKSRFNMLSNSEDVINAALGNFHLERPNPNPARPPSLSKFSDL